MPKSLINSLATELGDALRIRENVSAERLTTFAVGGPARILVEPRTPEALVRVGAALAASGVSARILGAGSNVVFPDDGIGEPVIHLGKEWDFITPLADGAVVEPDRLFACDAAPLPDARRFLVGAGSPLIALSRKLSAAGLTGLEFAAGIPASVGGAVRMNAGAHHSCIANVLESAVIADPRGFLRSVTPAELSFGYRHSELPAGCVVAAAVFRLERGEVGEIASRREACLAYRKQTQPLHLPSSGSVFRNPVPATETAPVFAARLLEECGLKGFRIGGVQFSEMHANWLVRADRNAKSHEVRELILLAKQKVFQHSRIELRQEVVLWESAPLAFEQSAEGIANRAGALN